MKTKYFILFFSILFFVLSIFLYKNVSNVDSHLDIDSKAYIERAQRFSQTGYFEEKGSPPYFVLGYPFILGVLYKTFGENSFFVILFQVILSLLSGFLIFRISKRLFNQCVALIAFFLFSINLGYLVFSQFILTEILLSFFLILFFDRFIEFFEKESFWSAVQSGLILGLSVLVKPAAIYFILILAFLSLFFLKCKFIRKFKLIFLLLFSFYLPVVSYMSFNKIRFDKFKLSALDNENIYYWFYPNVLAELNKTDSDIERAKLQSLVSGNKLEEKNWYKIKKRFWNDFRDNPSLFIKVWIKNVIKTFGGLYSTNLKVLIEPGVHGGKISFFKQSGNIFEKIKSYIVSGTNSLVIKIVAAEEFSWNFIRYFFVIFALMLLFFSGKFKYFFLFSSYIFYFSFITGHDGCARFRMMFEFVLIILIAYAFYQLFSLFFRKKQEFPIYRTG